jgi:hypothetical protein
MDLNSHRKDTLRHTIVFDQPLELFILYVTRKLLWAGCHAKSTY